MPLHGLLSLLYPFESCSRHYPGPWNLNDVNIWFDVLDFQYFPKEKAFDLRANQSSATVTIQQVPAI